MTLTADSAGDTLSILGRQGVTTAETADPDKVLVDVDLATLSGLEIDVNNKLKAKVDGTTIEIANPGGYLQAVQGAIDTLDDLDDVTFTLPLIDEDILVWDGTKWTDLHASVSGTTSTATGATSAFSSVSGNTTSVAAAGHSHSVTTQGAALQTHTHTTSQQPTSGPPNESGLKALTSLGTATGTVSALTSVSDTTSSVLTTGHYHDDTGLSVSFS